MVSNPKKATSYVVIIIKNKNLKIKTYKKILEQFMVCCENSFSDLAWPTHVFNCDDSFQPSFWFTILQDPTSSDKVIVMIIFVGCRTSLDYQTPCIFWSKFRLQAR